MVNFRNRSSTNFNITIVLYPQYHVFLIRHWISFCSEVLSTLGMKYIYCLMVNCCSQIHTKNNEYFTIFSKAMAYYFVTITLNSMFKVFCIRSEHFLK